MTTSAVPRFLVVFKRVLVDLGVPAGKSSGWLAVFERARGQILNRRAQTEETMHGCRSCGRWTNVGDHAHLVVVTVR
jgi:hypothetical protein